MKLIESMACIGEIQMHLYCIELDNYVNKLLLYTTYSDLFINVCRCLSLGHVSSGSLTMSVAILQFFQDLPGTVRRDMSHTLSMIRQRMGCTHARGTHPL